MTTSSENFLPADFPNGQEKLLRAVWKERFPSFWNEKTNRPSSAAFKDSKGLSVDRAGGRSDAEAVEYAKAHLHGYLVAATVDLCREINASPKYLPSRTNPYHSEIHGSDTMIPLSGKQAKHLARYATILFGPKESLISIQY